MKKKGTGLRGKVFKIIDKLYLKSYKKIVQKIYDRKDKTNFSNYQKLNGDYKREIKKYWKKYKVKYNYNEFKLYQKNFPKIEKSAKYIPKSIFHTYIEPYFNNVFISDFCSNKNYLELLLPTANLPKTVIRKVNGVIMNSKYEIISENNAVDIIKNYNSELIYKPAVESGGGRNIEFIDNNIEINKLHNLLNGDNYIVQEIIKQHKLLAEYNDTSVNTVRVLSFLYNNEVKVLYMVFRVGKNGMRLDNASLGATQICINKDGYFTDHIVTIDNKDINEDTKKIYIEKRMPFYDSIVVEVKRLHPFLSVCKLVGWDITIDENGKPVVVEVNLLDIGMTDKAQCVNGPLFGNLTSDILNEAIRGKKK